MPEGRVGCAAWGTLGQSDFRHMLASAAPRRPRRYSGFRLIQWLPMRSAQVAGGKEMWISFPPFERKDSPHGIVEFYQRMLKPPAPWKVSRVELSGDAGRVDIWLEHAPGVRFPCPACGEAHGLHDHTPEREWRHLDTMHADTRLHARLPRVRCPREGVVQVESPFAEGHGRLTWAMEGRAVDLVSECGRTGASRALNLSWDETGHVMERAVARGMERRPEGLPERMGIDEKAVFKRHKYCTIVTDLDKGTVVDVIDGRKLDEVKPWFETRAKEMESVKAMAMDMSATYINIGESYLKDPRKTLAFDRFHVSKLVNAAVDQTRKEERRALAGKPAAELLWKSRNLFLYNEENIPDERKEEFERIKRSDLRSAKAWAIKENLRLAWSQPDEESTIAFIKKWHWWATHSRIEPMRKAAKTIKAHLGGILNSIRLKVSNGPTEGINNKLETMKRDARGFGSKAKFRIAALFHCGGLRSESVV